MDLSIIIPAFNEERRLPNTLERIQAYLAARRLSVEVIVVDDGSTDRTSEVVETYHAYWPQLRLISNGCNRGKGFSIRHGMLEACGEIILFTDADLSAPIEEADKLLAALRDDRHDIAIGSRAINRQLIENHQSPFRELAGIIFNRVARWVVGLPFSDTQCGFKAFRRDCSRKVFEQQRTEGFGFDVEILFLARYYGLHVVEIPVRWAHNPATKVHVVRDSIGMFVELLAVRRNAWMGRYRAKQETST